VFSCSSPFDFFSTFEDAGTMRRGGGEGADAAHPGVVGDEEAAEKVAGDEEDEVAGT
jgi:hypothetical protein